MDAGKTIHMCDQQQELPVWRTNYIYIPPPSAKYTIEQRTYRKGGKRLKDGVLYKAEYYNGIYWAGTAETLMAAGLVKEHMLPGQPGRRKTVQSFPPMHHTYDKGMRIYRRSSRLFEVFMPFPIEYRERREVERAREHEVNRQEDQRIAKLESARKGVATLLIVARGHLLDDGDFLFDESTVCQFEQLAAEMESLLEGDEPAGNDATTPNPDSRVTAARNDQQLQSFLRAAAHDSSLIDSEKPEGL